MKRFFFFLRLPKKSQLLGGDDDDNDDDADVVGLTQQSEWEVLEMGWQELGSNNEEPIGLRRSKRERKSCPFPGYNRPYRKRATGQGHKPQVRSKPSLNDEQRARIDDFLKSEGDEKILLRGDASVYALDTNHLRDLLSPEKFISNNVIDAYADITLNSSERLLYIPISHSYRLANEGQNISLPGVTRQAIIRSTMIITPLAVRKHWVLVVCNISKKYLGYYSSVKSPVYGKAVDKVLSRLQKFLKDIDALDIGGWNRKGPLPCPSQGNTVDCGVFVMRFIYCLRHGIPFDIDEKNSAQFRAVIAYDLLSKIDTELKKDM